MQAIGKKNRTSLHSLYDFVLMTRGILCIGTGGPTYKRTRGLLCVGISNCPFARRFCLCALRAFLQLVVHDSMGWKGPKGIQPWTTSPFWLVVHAHLKWNMLQAGQPWTMILKSSLVPNPSGFEPLARSPMWPPTRLRCVLSWEMCTNLVLNLKVCIFANEKRKKIW